MRRITTIGAVLAALVIGGTGVASANQWYIQSPALEHERGNKSAANHRERIATGSAVDVRTEGEVKLHVVLNRRRLVIDCKTTGSELLSNPTRTTAFAETTSLAFSSCTGGAIVTNEPVPFSSELEGSCEPCLLAIPEAWQIQVGTEDLGVFEGVITENVGDFDNPIHDEIDHHAKWRGTKTEVLTGPMGTVKVGGNVNLGEEGAYVDGETNEGAEEESGEDKE